MSQTKGFRAIVVLSGCYQMAVMCGLMNYGKFEMAGQELYKPPLIKSEIGIL